MPSPAPREEEPLASIPSGDWLGSSSAEKDPRILENSKLNMSQNCALAAKVVSSILGYITRSIASRLREAIILLYLVLIRSHLECCVKFWAPQYKKVIDKVDQIQQRATKMSGGWSTCTMRRG